MTQASFFFFQQTEIYINKNFKGSENPFSESNSYYERGSSYMNLQCLAKFGTILVNLY